MGWKLNDLELGAASAVESVQDGPDGVALALAVTRAERRELQEMLQHAGHVHEELVPLGGRLVVDTSPNGENTLLLRANDAAGSAAPEMVDDGWYAAKDAGDDWRASTTVARLQATLARLAGLHEAEGVASATTQFLENDF